MFKLYFSPSACSLASHIALRECRLPFELVQVSLASKQTADGRDLHEINPKGYVPALVLTDGSVLTENAAVLPYIADQAAAAGLAPAPATMERYRLQEWISFIGTEMHKVFTPFFDPEAPESVKSKARTRLSGRLDWINTVLTRSPYLLGAHFSVADAYLFVILRATEAASLDLHRWPALQNYHDRIAARPHVAEALRVESAAPALA
jgi:glutathione S-transferase